jgi:hypothetical protein
MACSSLAPFLLSSAMGQAAIDLSPYLTRRESTIEGGVGEQGVSEGVGTAHLSEVAGGPEHGKGSLPLACPLPDEHQGRLGKPVSAVPIGDSPLDRSPLDRPDGISPVGGGGRARGRGRRHGKRHRLLSQAEDARNAQAHQLIVSEPTLEKPRLGMP